MNEDKPHYTRQQLNEWQRKDQRKRQQSADEAIRPSAERAPDGCTLWLDPSEPH